ncbi:hypothetical protein EKL98_12230 [Flavobacterium bomense]|uniref:Uncharacterized protein n=1 Tax=Flavobacterium bomense TaxID=2497483 RepID=A0A3S0PV33_9FLAO|nr:hypothetical protein [Flavobacterium bomense]RTZ03032.1 hypothetical protein EKL98_12230 [Flavobacterium bomense]
MSKRWRFQIKNGMRWGIILSLSLLVFDLFERSFEDAFFSKRNLFRTLYFVLFGIFVIGYLNWKKKIKRDNSADLSHDNTINK